jgi:hypothetical protein
VIHLFFGNSDRRYRFSGQLRDDLVRGTIERGLKKHWGILHDLRDNYGNLRRAITCAAQLLGFDGEVVRTAVALSWTGPENHLIKVKMQIDGRPLVLLEIDPANYAAIQAAAHALLHYHAPTISPASIWHHNGDQAGSTIPNAMQAIYKMKRIIEASNRILEKELLTAGLDQAVTADRQLAEQKLMSLVHRVYDDLGNSDATAD